MPFARNGQISRAPLDGAIEISNEQYSEALAGMLEGMLVTIDGGFAVAHPVEEPVPEPVPPTLAEAKAAKLSEVADKRLAVETGGIVFGGLPIPTDRQTAAIITAAFVMASADPGYLVENWKVTDELFITLDAQAIIALAAAVREHVQASFNRNAALSLAVQALDTVEAINVFDVAAQWDAEAVP